jgi:ABC-2 type transport system ATP-binding protein
MPPSEAQTFDTAVEPATPQANGDYAVVVEGLRKSFGGKVVVRDLSMRVKRGHIYGFLGPNGSGKTTTLRMICGLLTPDAGHGTCLSFDILTQRDEIKRRVGYMTQRFSLYEDLSIKENLEFVARVYGLADPVGEARAEIEHLGLQGRELQLAGTLSGGWKQRIALACATIHEPPLLFLDEPTAGVDPVSRRQFWDQIHTIASQGTTVLVTTHYMDEAERCHRLAFIFRGELLAVGAPDEVVAARALTVLEVELERAVEAAELLRGLPEVDAVSHFGRTMRVALRGSAEPEALLRAALAARGFELQRVAAVRPTVEDAFVSMVREDEQRRARAGHEAAA